MFEIVVRKGHLQRARELQGPATIEEQAEALNVHPTRLYRFQNGTKVSSDFIARIHQVYGYGFEFFEFVPAKEVKA